MIQLHTLGSLTLRKGGADAHSVLSQPRRLALLVYLATARPPGPHLRDRLLALFWPDSDDERGRLALRQALHQLRRSLGAHVITAGDADEVQIDPAELWCDARAFDDALERGAPAEAVELYRGEFMPGFVVDTGVALERFFEEQRDRYRREAVAAAWTLATEDEGRGDLRAAAARGRLALSYDPHDESTLVRLVGLLDRVGERPDAIRLFEDFARRLDAEYQLTPSAETLRLIEALRVAPMSAPERGPERERPGAPPVLESPAPPPALVSPAPPADAGASAAEPARASMPGPAPGARPPAPTHRPVPPEPAWRRWPKAWVIAAAAAAVVALIGLRSAERRDLPAEPGAVSAASPVSSTEEAAAVAVLPFVNMSGDPANDFFSDGVAEEVAHALSRVPGLRVAGRTSSLRFKGKDVGVDSIGRALGVEYVLEGSVRMTGDRVRILAQLIDAASGFHLWSDVWDGSLTDVLAVQDEIARSVVDELQPRFTGTVGTSSAGAPGDRDPRAHADVLRGLKALSSGALADYARADTFFTRAIERDPGYARAFAGLAAVHLVLAYTGEQPAESGFQRAANLAERALELDPTLADAFAVLGRVAQSYWGDLDLADRYSRRAIELSPGSETWYRQRALILAYMGRFDEAVSLARRSIEIDPLATGAHRHLGRVLFFARDYQRAVDAYENALALTPSHDVTLLYLSQSLSMLERHAEAVEAAGAALQQDPETPLVLANAAWVQARASHPEAARQLLERLETADHPSLVLRAQVHTALGESGTALDLLARALQSRDPLVVEVATFPAFDPLRSEARFQGLVERVGERRR